jgi:hypothetical protein
MSSWNKCVVMLDDARFGAGPGTVVELTNDGVAAILDRYRERDGARSEKLRIWTASPGLSVGDRVRMKQHDQERSR